MATDDARNTSTCAQSSPSCWIDLVEAYMRRCMNARTSARASELAVELKLTPPTLARHFKKAVGITLGEYMKQRQLECAKELLLASDVDASDVAVRTGWGTARTFFRAFRRAEGITPLEYRRRRNVCGGEKKSR